MSIRMFCDIHTHCNPRPDVTAVVDISGRGVFLGVENYLSNRLVSANIQFFSIGIHPKSISEDWQRQLVEIEQLAHHPSFVGEGECGLDKFADAPRDLQENVFRAQLLLAQQLNKPIIIHCVRLYTDVLRLIKETRFLQPAIFHGYNGNPAITAQLLKLPNTYFSFSARTFATPETSGAKSIPIIPPSRILTETDEDEKADISLVINQLSEHINIAPATLQQIVLENFVHITTGNFSRA